MGIPAAGDLFFFLPGMQWPRCGGRITKKAVFLLWEIAITSAKHNVNIFFPLSDPVFSDTCKIDTKFLSLNYLGSYVEPQPSKGCVLSGPDKDREVHIVELQAPNSSRWASKAKKTYFMLRSRCSCWSLQSCFRWKQHEGRFRVCGGGGVLFTFGIFLLNIFQNSLSECSFARQCSPSLIWVIIYFTQKASNMGNPGALAVLNLTLLLLVCLSRNTASILMSWTDARGAIPGPDLNLSKRSIAMFFLQCFPGGRYSGAAADEGWHPPTSWRGLAAEVCQVCQLGHPDTRCWRQAGYSGKIATRMASHCSSDKRFCHIGMCDASSASL